jgi:hypothetical protein
MALCLWPFLKKEIMVSITNTFFYNYVLIDDVLSAIIGATIDVLSAWFLKKFP